MRTRLPASVRACLFDLDGVLTDTASVHAAAWTDVFDRYLKRRAERTGETFRPFDPVADYRAFVDGRTREDGVRTFLHSRGITLPEGGDAGAGQDTVAGLGRRKNAMFLERLQADGVHVFDGSRRFLSAVLEKGMRVAVVSSSANVDAILDAAGLSDQLATRVDGRLLRREGLAGKPAPDAYLRAASLLDVRPTEAAVFEDAEAGVSAGRAGGFGVVVGVDRGTRGEALRSAGADFVVPDLGALLVR